jgi:hypothetical protein
MEGLTRLEESSEDSLEGRFKETFSVTMVLWATAGALMVVGVPVLLVLATSSQCGHNQSDRDVGNLA